MKFQTAKSISSTSAWIVYASVFACFLLTASLSAQQTQPKSNPIPPRTFETPEQAVEMLLEAAEKVDLVALEQIFGSKGIEIVSTGEPARNKEIMGKFVELSREKKSVSIDPKNKNHATLILGNDDWPFAIPIIKKGGKWFFDSEAGREELINRRIGGNELDAIEICRGFVEAQHEYALEKHEGSTVNQYAQRIISTPGKQDGLAWKDAKGEWDGPIGENAAKAIESGYSAGEPYHGYFFKVLKGQGPAAPLGQMDFVVDGAMIGGFALVAAPAEYDVTGIKTFMVSHDGVVYEKDLGPDTLNEFKKIELFNPDKTWTPVEED
jgi:Protein of unknown function (DUF2950)